MSVDGSDLGLVQDLEKVGVQVTSVWDLVNGPDTYPQAEPLLVDWLHHLDERVPPEHRRRLREGLVRSLTTARNRELVLPVMFNLIWRIRKEDEPGTHWAIGNAIGHLARKKDLPELRRICADPSLGRSRQAVIEALRRLRDTESNSLLVELLTDPGVTGHAAWALAKVGDASALAPLEVAAADSAHTAWQRREAAKAARMITERSSAPGQAPGVTAGTK